VEYAVFVLFHGSTSITLFLHQTPLWLAKDFPVDDGVEFGKEVVDLIDFIELCFEVEEAELSFGFAHGNETKGEMMNESIVTQGRNLSRRKYSTDK
jgi:hypothetical protein